MSRKQLIVFCKTTHDSCLRWFQYNVYMLLPTGHFVLLRKMVDSLTCSFCNHADETVLLTFLDCSKIRNYWPDVVVVVVAFSSRARILGECSTIHSPSMLFF